MGRVRLSVKIMSGELLIYLKNHEIDDPKDRDMQPPMTLFPVGPIDVPSASSTKSRANFVVFLI